jgi:hypothetical protein
MCICIARVFVCFLPRLFVLSQMFPVTARVENVALKSYLLCVILSNCNHYNLTMAPQAQMSRTMIFSG